MPSLNLSTRRRSDRGVSALVFAIMIPLIIGAVGLSVDGGRMAIERANLQSAADNAARAIGQDCARASRPGASGATLSRCTNSSTIDNTIQLAVNGNATGADGSVVFPSSGTAKVTATKTVPMTLGATIGIQPKSIAAAATVTWNQTPIAANTLPLSMDICDYNEWKASASSTPRLYRYDEEGSGRGKNHVDAKPCGSDQSVGGSMWIAPKNTAGDPPFDFAKCVLQTQAGTIPDYRIQPHNPGWYDSCERADLLVKDGTYLMIVGENSEGWGGQGDVRVPTIRGYVPFVVTGWRFGPKQRVEYQGGTLPSSCTSDKDCRGIQGYFTSSVVELSGATYSTGTGTDFGSIRVKITS